MHRLSAKRLALLHTYDLHHNGRLLAGANCWLV